MEEVASPLIRIASRQNATTAMAKQNKPQEKRISNCRQRNMTEHGMLRAFFKEKHGAITARGDGKA
jgi:hypothetical protein